MQVGYFIFPLSHRLRLDEFIIRAKITANTQSGTWFAASEYFFQQGIISEGSLNKYLCLLMP